MKITDEALWESSEEELEQAVTYGTEKMKRWRQQRLNGAVETDEEWIYKFDSLMLSMNDEEFNRVFGEMEDTLKRAEKILNEKKYNATIERMEAYNRERNKSKNEAIIEQKSNEEIEIVDIVL